MVLDTVFTADTADVTSAAVTGSIDQLLTKVIYVAFDVESHAMLIVNREHSQTEYCMTILCCLSQCVGAK